METKEEAKEPLVSAENEIKETEIVPVGEAEPDALEDLNIGLSKEHAEEKLKEAMDNQSPKKRKKKHNNQSLFVAYKHCVYGVYYKVANF